MPKDESAGINVIDETNVKQQVSKTTDASTLIVTCRAARTKEDSNLFYLQDSFKIKSLLSNGETFTC